mgnify:FL=1
MSSKCTAFRSNRTNRERPSSGQEDPLTARAQAFAAPDATYHPLTAAKVIARNQDKPVG